jgi:hypothetical protein
MARISPYLLHVPDQLLILAEALLESLTSQQCSLCRDMLVLVDEFFEAPMSIFSGQLLLNLAVVGVEPALTIS